jgi:hypothetical protein
MTYCQKVLVSGLALGLCALMPDGAGAFAYQLSEEAVRDAYFLGQNVQKAAPFLRQYVRRFPAPKKGPYVCEIDLRTPYAEVVRRALEHSLDYTAQRAQKDYWAQPARVIVTVQIFFTRTYGYITPPTDSKGQAVKRPEEFWREFPVRVTQEHSIEANKVTSRLLHGRYGKLSGAEVLLEFAPEQFASRVTQVTVNTPDGQTIEANFDLDALR